MERKLCKFARMPLKQCKTCSESSAARDTWNLGRSMALREAAPAPPAPGPSSESRRPTPGGSQAARKSGRTAVDSDHGCWPGHGLRAQWPRRVSGPSSCPYTVFARATHSRPLPTAVSPSIPLTCSALALVFWVYW